MLSLDNTWLKLERAEEHLKSLESEIEGFFTSNPYTVNSEYDFQGLLKTFSIQLHGDIPVRLGLIAGDAAHNMRASLDALVWQLALLTTNAPFSRSEFPIFANHTLQVEKDIASKIRNVPQRAQHIIKSLQPYHRGQRAQENILWILQCLDITDKHQIIPLVEYAIQVESPTRPCLKNMDVVIK